MSVWWCGTMPSEGEAMRTYCVSARTLLSVSECGCGGKEESGKENTRRQRERCTRLRGWRTDQVVPDRESDCVYALTVYGIARGPLRIRLLMRSKMCQGELTWVEAPSRGRVGYDVGRSRLQSGVQRVENVKRSGGWSCRQVR